MNTMTHAHHVISSRFTEKWPAITETVAEAFNMDAKEREWLRNKNIAQLIAAIPFEAGCEQPERTAVAHLCTYILSVKETKPFFNADVTDDIDVLERLRLIMNFRGGDRRIIDKGMSLIALVMVDDYQRDITIDKMLGKHNPVASGAFDYTETRADLIRRIETVDCPALESIYAEDLMGTRGGWR